MIPAHDILDALADHRRRSVCEVLADADREFLSLEDVAERVAGRETGRVEASQVRVGLHHVHLPKLDNAGLLEYDHDANAVHYEGDPVVESVADGVDPLDAVQEEVDIEEPSPRDW